MTSYLFLATLIAVFYLIYLYNGIIRGKNSCKRAWADVLTYSQQKLKVVSKIEEKTKEYKDFEESTLKTIVELRSRVASISKEKPNPGLLEALNKEMSKAMSALKVSVEEYPELKSSDLYMRVMKEVSEQEENVAAAIVIFNRNVEGFNNNIQAFPNVVLNKIMFKEETINSFKTQEAEKDVEFSPNLG